MRQPRRKPGLPIFLTRIKVIENGTFHVCSIPGNGVTGHTIVHVYDGGHLNVQGGIATVMDSERFQLAERLFHEAMAQAPARRGLYIDEAVRRVGGDRELAERVRRLIDFAQNAAPPSLDLGHEIRQAMASPDRLVGATIERYRITRLIGEGGFGAVYQAEQDAPVRRTVALKILKRGMDSEQVIARFGAERQALAMMEHPNVARVFDAGQTDESSGGRPYFVMELVSGEPITHYCDARKLSVRGRLELFIAVCQAVQHAHQKGIIHRDLKPSNILVMDLDGKATPKIIDFGIAKAIAQPVAGSAAILTQRLELLGTPQYMSPEQIDGGGQAIDTRSDIYSLGVVLYELLTGVTPLELPRNEGISYSRVQALVRERVVERPSQRVLHVEDDARTATSRMKLESSALSKRLRGDLDWILLKALESDRDRRYASTSALADDIVRHLENQPVLAGPPSAAYRVRKFVRRHKVGVVAASLVLLTIIAGVSATALAMLRAQDAAEQANAINQFMREVLTSPNPDRRGADVKLIAVLDEASARASSQFAGHPRLEAEVRELLGMVYAKLWRMDDGINEFRRVVDLRRASWGPDHPQALRAEAQLARAYNAARRVNDLEQLTAQLLPRARRVLGPHHADTAMAEQLAARVHLYRGRVDEGEAAMRATFAWVNDQFARDSEIRLTVLDGVIEAITSRHRRLDSDSPEAVALLDEMAPMLTEMRDVELKRSGPTATTTLFVEGRLADLALHKHEYDRAIDIAQSILDRSANVLSECHDIRSDAWDQIARAKRRQGDVYEAATIILARLECAKSTQGENDVNTIAAMSDAMPYLDAAGYVSQGEAIARQLQTRFAKMSKSLGPMVFGPEVYLARFLTLQGRLDEARPLFEKWLNDEASLDTRHTRARLHLFYGGFLTKLGRFEEAETHINQAVQILGNAMAGTWREHPDEMHSEYIALYDAWNKPDKAAEYRKLREQVFVPSKRKSP